MTDCLWPPCCVVVGPRWWQRWSRGAWRPWLSCEFYSKCITQKWLSQGNAFQSASAHRRSTLCPVVMIHNYGPLSTTAHGCFKQGVTQVSIPEVFLKANVAAAGQHLTMPCAYLSTLQWQNEQHHLTRGICDYQGNTLGKMCTRLVVSVLVNSRLMCPWLYCLSWGDLCSLLVFLSKARAGLWIILCAPDALFAGHLHWLICKVWLSLTSIQKQQVRVTHYSNLHKSFNSPG